MVSILEVYADREYCRSAFPSRHDSLERLSYEILAALPREDFELLQRCRESTLLELDQHPGIAFERDAAFVL